MKNILYTLLAVSFLLIVSCQKKSTPPSELSKTGDYDVPPQETQKDLVFDYGCTDCHRVKGKLVGPSFIDIATRYKDSPDAKTVLSDSILKGSKGKWPNDYHGFPMPPQNQVSKEDAFKMVGWITSLSK
ncbi:MAG: c-type cytochrome [Acidobacteriaceae bacterium]